jgi:hypothetical protein
MDRRELLTSAGALTLGSLTVGFGRAASPPATPTASSLRDEPLRDAVDDEQAHFNHFVSEIARFARIVERQPKAHEFVAAANRLPFGCHPVSRAAQCPEWVFALPEPQIQPLLTDLTQGFSPLQRLLRQLWLHPAGWQCVSQLQTHEYVKASRCVTPCWTFDVEDAQSFNCHNLALVVWQMVHAIRAELLAGRADAAQSFRNIMGELPVRSVAEYRPVQAYCQLKGYTLEMFAWTTCFGYITVDRD